MDSTTLLQILLPIAILQIILLVTALVSLIKQEHTNGPKWLWAIIIVFVNIIGPVLYFIIGRKER
ncbi:PLD nuclease N-terminal domain-containing protein [Bacillus massiliigorillae]|uniref:PLD nuclease N-terminal domain-containing protein n=1 Tax=Bacillus massiliigorillae TaxID=1243664 RepID=UPI000399BBC6|nr:PLD nuclease N-terminal domain-containing protein [Bacillus massiliigorillae]